MDKYTFVHTQCCDAEDGRIETKVRSGRSKEEAQGCCRVEVRELIYEVLANELFQSTIRIGSFKALVKIEGMHHVVAINKEG